MSGGVVYAAASSGSNPVRMTALQYGTGITHMIKGVQVSGGICRLAIYEAEETGTAATYSTPTNVTYTASSEYEFLQGGDYSRLNLMTDHGASYTDGTYTDAVDIAAANGANIVRLRVMNDPGNASYTPSGYMTAGYVNTTDMLKLAAKAKAKGLQILLTIYYSDYWCDPAKHYVPHEWADYTESELQTAVYDFTYSVLSQMQSQSTLPEYVAIGNESNCGFFFGEDTSSSSSYYCNYQKFVNFFNQGAKAVRAISTGIKVMCHFTNATADSGLGWLFTHMINYGADYDVIGLSYYPYWTQVNAATFMAKADEYASQTGKKVLIMESGYNWNTKNSYGYTGQLENNGPYDATYGTSEEAQRNYLQELCNEIKKSDSVIGYLYWDPLTVPIDIESYSDLYNTLAGDGYSHENEDTGSSTQNSSLFDFSGNRLDAWDAFKYNN